MKYPEPHLKNGGSETLGAIHVIKYQKGGGAYRQPREAGALLLAALSGPAHVAAGCALGGQQPRAAAQTLCGAGQPGVTARVGVALLQALGSCPTGALDQV